MDSIEHFHRALYGIMQPKSYRRGLVNCRPATSGLPGQLPGCLADKPQPASLRIRMEPVGPSASAESKGKGGGGGWQVAGVWLA
eukprot:282823-Chlamydomonas_euryale.AAC.1